MMRLGPVIGVGAATWDHFYVVKSFPSVEGISEAEASYFDGGGPVATALCVMARLGLSAILIDVQGRDAIGEFIRNDLARRGVDLSHVRLEDGAASPHAAVLVRQSDASRHITYFPSSATPLTAADVPPNILAGAALLHLNGRHEEAAREAVRQAQTHGVPISFDGGAGRYRTGIRDLVLASQVRIVAREFAEALTGKREVEAHAEDLLDDNARIVVITDGSRGSHVFSHDGERFHQPAMPAVPLVDTTGCGDVFHGAFLGAWLLGQPLRVCAERASYLAALTARSLGGRAALNTGALSHFLESDSR